MAGALIRLLSATIVVVTLAATAVIGQDVFRTSTDMVLLNVTASLGTRAATGLAKDDFQVLEDGRPQEITVYSREPQPISLSILMDASTSMEGRMATAQEAAIGLVRRLGPQDEAQVVTFTDDTRIQQQFTGDVALLERAIRSTRASGSTGLYNAVYIALDELRRRDRPPTIDEPVRRQAIVLLSDGEDTTSILKHDDVLDRTKRSNVIVFAIGLRSRPDSGGGYRGDEYALRSLAVATGGRAFFVNAVEELPAIYAQIADELANQYTIGYTSKNPARDGGWRVVSVRVSRPGVVARTRAGYFGPASKGK